jgi:serine/threonine protein kinase
MVVDTLSWVGKTLAGGRYRVTALLGEGGMGSVYRAHDAHLDAEVVIKVPKAGLLADREFAARFGREVRSLVRLAHAHIVRVLDVGEHEGLPFAVMQFLAGGSLRERTARLAPGGPAAAMPDLASWLPGVANALDYIHSQGYVHRDVKPDNILFDAAGHVCLGDFGIAKALAGSEGAGTMAFRTTAGLVIGTPQYMAPELVVGDAGSGAADQYALAVTAYEAVCGRLPFDGNTLPALAVQHATRPVPPPHEVAAAVPRTFSAVLLRGLHKEPAARFPDCRSLAQALLVSLQGPAAPHPATFKERSGPVPAIPVAPTPAPAVPATGPEFPCPSCGTVFRLPPQPEGKQLRCRHCGSNFKVPSTLPGVRADTDAVASAQAATAKPVPAAPPPLPPPPPRLQGYPCPSCGKVFAAPAHLRGKRVRCKKCQATFLLPPTLPPASPSASGGIPALDARSGMPEWLEEVKESSAGQRPPSIPELPAKTGKRRFSRRFWLGLVACTTGIALLTAAGLGLWAWLSSPIGDELKYMPADAQVIFAVRVDKLLASDAYKQFRQESRASEKEAGELEKHVEEAFGLPVSAIERIVFSAGSSGESVAVRTTREVSAADLLGLIKRRSLFKESKVEAHTLHESEDRDGSALCVVNKKLVLYGTSRGLRAALQRDKKPEFSEGLRAAMGQVDFSRTVALACDLKSPDFTRGLRSGGGDNDATKVLEQVQGLAVQVKVGSDIAAQYTLLCKDAVGADEVKKLLDATLLVLRKNKELSRDAGELLNVTLAVSGSKVTGAASFKAVTVSEALKNADLLSESFGRLGGFRTTPTPKKEYKK